MRGGAVRPVIVSWCTVVLCLMTARVQLASQQPAGARTVMTVEFRAVKDGVPVLDLKPLEIVLRVNNVEQEVRALDTIPLDASAAPSPFATNTGASRGRDLIVVIDEESVATGSEKVLRDALAELLRQLTARDRVGLVSLHPSGASVALTAGPSAVEKAIPLVRGRAIGTESPSDLACRTRRELPAISSLMQGLTGGVTTTVLLFSAALAAPGPVADLTGVAASACMLQPSDFDEFRAAAARSGAELHAIHIADASANQEDPRVRAGLEKLAGETGGRFSRLIGDPAPLMKRIASDTAGFYAASFVLASDGRGPARRSVDLRIRRDGVTARVRPEIVLPTLETKTVSPREMMRVSTAYRALPLRAAGFPSRNADNNTAKVVVLFEPAEPSVSLASAMVGAFNAKGQLTAQWAGEREDLARRPVAAGLVVPAGTYRVRVAAVDSTGRSGAVDEELHAELASAGSATTSAVVLGVPDATGFSPRLQFTAADSTAALYVEVYGASCAAMSGRIDVAASQDGPSLATSAAAPTQVEQSDACILYGEFNLSVLPPSDYVIRLELRLNGQLIATRIRTLRKS